MTEQDRNIEIAEDTGQIPESREEGQGGTANPEGGGQEGGGNPEGAGQEGSGNLEGAGREGSGNSEGAGQEGSGSAEGADGQDSLAYIESLLDERIVRAIREMGFDKLTPIQEQAIPCLLQGEDIIGQAQTGTGKTAAFGIPALQKIDPDLRKLQTIVLCPTRELAMQAAEEIRRIAKYMQGIKVLPVYGGQDISRQISGLRGVQIIVGTPGRVMDHMRRHTIKLDHVNMVVLDEADEMLDMGFREDMELILGEIPGEHQTALFSATMPQPILDITNQFQKDAKIVKVASQELTIPLVSQRYYRIKAKDKDAACIRLLEYFQPKLCLIFCNTKIKVDELAEVIKKAGFQAEGLHGDMSQHQRDVAMNRFRNGSTNILIATDVAARGIDVYNVEAVINYDLPQDIEYYVHRIGRTGRAGKTGRSFTFVGAKELYRIRQIERFCNTTIEEKKLPGAAKVQKAKADKYLNRAWELHEHEDVELMKSQEIVEYGDQISAKQAEINNLQKKIEAEGCDALDLAAAMLKYQVGDMGPEIDADTVESRRSGRTGERSENSRRRRFEREAGRGREQRGEDRDGRRRDRRGEDRDGRRRDRREEDRDGRRRSRREEDRDGRRRSRREDRDGVSRFDRGEERENHRAFEHESRESRRGSARGEDHDGRRRQDAWEEEWSARRKGDKDRSHVSKVRDVKRDGSEKGLAFSFPRKKKRS